MASHALDLCLYMKRWVDRSPETCEQRNTCFSELEMHRREDIRLQKAMRKTRHEYARRFIKLHLQVVRNNTNILMNRIQLYNIVKKIEEATRNALNELKLDQSLEGDKLEDGLLKLVENKIQTDKGSPEGANAPGTSRESSDASDSDSEEDSDSEDASDSKNAPGTSRESSDASGTEEGIASENEETDASDHKTGPQITRPEQTKVEKFIQGTSKLKEIWKVIKKGITNRWVIILFIGALTAAYVANYGIDGIADLKPWVQGEVDAYYNCEQSNSCYHAHPQGSTDYMYTTLKILGDHYGIEIPEGLNNANRVNLHPV